MRITHQLPKDAICIECKWVVREPALHEVITYENSDDLDIRCSNPAVPKEGNPSTKHLVTGAISESNLKLRLCSVERSNGLTLYRPCGYEGKLWEPQNGNE